MPRGVPKYREAAYKPKKFTTEDLKEANAEILEYDGVAYAKTEDIIWFKSAIDGSWRKLKTSKYNKNLDKDWEIFKGIKGD